MVNPHSSNFRVTTTNVLGVRKLRIITVIMSLLNGAHQATFVSSSILSWQILTAHAQPFRGARDLAFCLKVPLDSLLVWASSEGSGETARMRRLIWTFAARIGDKYQIRLTWSKLKSHGIHGGSICSISELNSNQTKTCAGDRNSWSCTLPLMWASGLQP